MSLRSEPTITPEHRDPVSRNQPDSNEVGGGRGKGFGAAAMQGGYPTSPKDSTSSGGYGAQLNSAWSREVQSGIDMPLKLDDVAGINSNHNDAGLVEQSTSGTRLSDKLQDAKQGRDTKLS